MQSLLNNNLSLGISSDVANHSIDQLSVTAFPSASQSSLLLPPQRLTVPSYSSFSYTYYYNGQDNQADTYSGTVIEKSDRYAIGDWIDPVVAPNETGKNGRYLITGLTPTPLLTLGQTTVERYYDAESSRSVVPDTGYGTFGLGSEVGSLNALLRPQDRFGGDRWEADFWDARPQDPGVSRGKPSGLATIDALLNEDALHWNTSRNGGVITYSFYNATSGDYSLSAKGSSEVAADVSESIKSNVREMLAGLEAYLNVEFVEVPDTTVNPGVLRYLYSVGTDGPYYAYAYYPGSGSGGDVHLSKRFDRDAVNSFGGTSGSYGYKSLLHETLHALGLKHPGRYEISGFVPEGPFLEANADHAGNSIMSYNGGGFYPVTAMGYDVAALQYLYGARNIYAEDNTYRFESVSSYDVLNADGKSLQTIGNFTQPVKRTLFDAGGIDTLDFSQLKWATAQRIDLRPGGIITYQSAYQSQTYNSVVDGQTYRLSDYGTTLASSSLFEKLIASPGDDEIFANAANNTFMGYRQGKRSGNDVIKLADAGDRLVLEGYSLRDLTAQPSGQDLLISLGRDGSLRLRNYYEVGIAAPTGFFTSCFTPLPESVRVNIEGQDYAYYSMAGWVAIPPSTVPTSQPSLPLSRGLSPNESSYPLATPAPV